MSAAAAVSRDQQLEWEARLGPLAAVAAFLAAALGVGSAVVQIALVGAPPDQEREGLISFDEHQSEFFVSFGLQALSYVMLAAALFYLLRATTHRRPEVPKFAAGLLLLAPLLIAAGGLLKQLELNDIADQFLAGKRSEARADALLDDRNVVGDAIALGGALCVALSLVLVSLNAMRAGLLSRFMGVLGIIAGGLLVLPLLPGAQSPIQIFWVIALGMLFLDRWPGGRGPAWEAGESVPWPSAADLRGEGPEQPAEPEEPEEPEEPVRPASRKRKRKKRR